MSNWRSIAEGAAWLVLAAVAVAVVHVKDKLGLWQSDDNSSRLVDNRCGGKDEAEI